MADGSQQETEQQSQEQDVDTFGQTETTDVSGEIKPSASKKIHYIFHEVNETRSSGYLHIRRARVLMLVNFKFAKKQTETWIQHAKRNRDDVANDYVRLENTMIDGLGYEDFMWEVFNDKSKYLSPQDQNLFEGFEPHKDEIQYTSWTKAQMEAMVRAMAKASYADGHAFFIFLNSHGTSIKGKEAVHGTDNEPFLVERVIEILDKEGHPDNKSIPKFVCIQACRGEKQIPLSEISYADDNFESSNYSEPENTAAQLPEQVEQLRVVPMPEALYSRTRSNIATNNEHPKSIQTEVSGPGDTINKEATATMGTGMAGEGDATRGRSTRECTTQISGSGDNARGEMTPTGSASDDNNRGESTASGATTLSGSEDSTRVETTSANASGMSGSGDNNGGREIPLQRAGGESSSKDTEMFFSPPVTCPNEFLIMYSTPKGCVTDRLPRDELDHIIYEGCLYTQTFCLHLEQCLEGMGSEQGVSLLPLLTGVNNEATLRWNQCPELMHCLTHNPVLFKNRNIENKDRLPAPSLC